MKKVILLVIAVLALVGLSGSQAFAQGTTLTIKLGEQNSSGQTGTATLTDLGNNQVMVTLNLSNGTAEPQPAHIHKGTCANLDPKPAIPLNSVVNGKSETTVDVSTVDPNGAYAINVHKSAAEAKVYVACGDIVADTTSAGGTTSVGMPRTGNSDQSLLVALGVLALIMTGTGLKLARRKA